ncbi:hypothetical protein NC652_037330 [Populus alba x Populus x berolinensis]|nr:hypothetical protein NC652_037330 [Populus alba x Populus x berolinensis]
MVPGMPQSSTLWQATVWTCRYSRAEWDEVFDLRRPCISFQI